MGFRARKSFKVMPGVRMTVSPRGVSTRVGVRGAGVSLGSDGRVRSSVGVPGSGVGYTHVHGSRARGARSIGRVAVPPAAKPPSPGLLAPKWEKALHKALVVNRDYAGLQAVGEQYHEARPHAATFGAIGHHVPEKNYDRATELLRWVFHSGFDPSTDPFVRKYLGSPSLEIGVADGVTAQLPLDRQLVGLTLVELLQQVDDLDAAVDLAEQLEPTTISAVSLAELYGQQARWQDVVDLTEGVKNEDDASTYLLMQRGVAFRELGMHVAAREALKEALRVRSRPQELRLQALVERASTYIAEGKAGMARKDLERVMAEDGHFPGVRDAMANLAP